MTKLVVPPEEILRQAKIEVTIPSLIRALNHPHASVRESAIRLLGKAADKSVIPNLKMRLNDQNLVVRCVTASSLRILGDNSGIDVVLDCINKGNSNIKVVAVRTLAEFKDDSRTVSTLMTLLDDNYKYVRMCAADELGNIGTTSSLPKLVKLLSDSSPEVRYAVNRALEKITRKSFGFSHTAPEKEREAAVKQWTTYLGFQNVNW